MTRLVFAAALLAAAGPALADTATMPLYRVTLATPTTATMMIRDVRWACAGSACAAPRTASSPDTSVCMGVARRLGAITRFAAAGREFDAAELARCNAAAR